MQGMAAFGRTSVLCVLVEPCVVGRGTHDEVPGTEGAKGRRVSHHMSCRREGTGRVVGDDSNSKWHGLDGCSKAVPTTTPSRSIRRSTAEGALGGMACTDSKSIY